MRLELLQRTLRDAQIELELSRDRYASLYDFAPIGYVTLDPEGVIVEINLNGARLLGQTREELTGKSLMRFVHTGDMKRLLRFLDALLQSRVEQRIGLQLYLSGNIRARVELFGVALGPTDMTESSIRIAFIDNTAHLQAEHDLADREQMYNALTTLAPVGLARFDRSGLCTYANTDWERLTGRPAAFALGDGWLRAVHPEDRRKITQLWNATVSAHQVPGSSPLPFQAEYRLQLKTGPTWVLARATVERNGSPDPRGFIQAILDISELKETQESLRAAREELSQRVVERTAELQKSNTELAAQMHERKRLEEEVSQVTEREQRRIGHDLHDGLGQQLTGVAFLSKSLAQTLRAQHLPEAREAETIAELVDQSITTARDLAKGLQPVQEDPSALMAALREYAIGIEKTFRISCRFLCPEPVLLPNPDMATHLYRVAQEAVHNALKHGHATRIIVRLTVRDRQGTLSVWNNGRKIDAAKKNGQGSGLRIMHYRVSRIGGELKVFCPPRGGTKVKCDFPYESIAKSKTNKPVAS